MRLCKPFTPRQILMYTYFIYFVGWWFFTAGYKQGIFCIWGAIIYFVSTVCMWQKRGTVKELPAEPAVLDKVSEQEQAQA